MREGYKRRECKQKPRVDVRGVGDLSFALIVVSIEKEEKKKKIPSSFIQENKNFY